ncbi:hypothetical protein AB6A40_001096 [Gnathostoma spinigerum]|uniref:Abnormal cell migration protein 18-like fibronectin type I domain-containing protein n=1 Tax=Gnathostoma spinigerum TaxID=75299 RepID=A0ABD6ECG6_9BILA
MGGIVELVGYNPQCRIMFGMKQTLVLLACISAIIACVYDGKTYHDGQIWAIRRFLFQCEEYDDGSWRSKVIACVTPGGTVVSVGTAAVEDESEFECVRGKGMVVSLIQNYLSTEQPESSSSHDLCDGHNVGESWISTGSFNKTCTSDGVVISNCITEDGDAVPLGGEFRRKGNLWKCKPTADGLATLALFPDITSTPKQSKEKREVDCLDNGKVKRFGEIYHDGMFIKRCGRDGIFTVEACDPHEIPPMPLNTILVVGDKRFYCLKKPDGSISFRFEFVE